MKYVCNLCNNPCFLILEVTKLIPGFCPFIEGSGARWVLQGADKKCYEEKDRCDDCPVDFPDKQYTEYPGYNEGDKYEVY